MILIGSTLTAVGVNDLVLPAHLMSGGLTGISIVLYHFFRLPVGATYMALNLPLLWLAYQSIGKKFSLYTILSVIALSTALAIVPIHRFVTDGLLSAIFGGVVVGGGSAVILRAGGSSGGVDIVTRVLATKRDANIGRVSLVLNGAIIIVSAFLFTVQTAMYTLISIFAAAKAYDVLLNHVDRISVIVVSNHGVAISKRIIESMQRGVTVWDAHGAYTSGSKQVVFCVIVNVQFAELRHIILGEDPDAFIAIVPTKRVVGQFNQVW